MSELLELEDVDYVRRTETELIVRNSEGEEQWLPLSLISEADPTIEEFEGLEEGTPIVIEIPEWLAKAKGLM